MELGKIPATFNEILKIVWREKVEKLAMIAFSGLSRGGPRLDWVLRGEVPKYRYSRSLGSRIGVRACMKLYDFPRGCFF